MRRGRDNAKVKIPQLSERGGIRCQGTQQDHTEVIERHLKAARK